MSVNEVGPHEFRPLGRFRHRNKCAACYCSRESHPIRLYVISRPIGETSSFPPDSVWDAPPRAKA